MDRLFRVQLGKFGVSSRQAIDDLRGILLDPGDPYFGDALHARTSLHRYIEDLAGSCLPSCTDTSVSIVVLISLRDLLLADSGATELVRSSAICSRSPRYHLQAFPPTMTSGLNKFSLGNSKSATSRHCPRQTRYLLLCRSWDEFPHVLFIDEGDSSSSHMFLFSSIWYVWFQYMSTLTTMFMQVYISHYNMDNGGDQVRAKSPMYVVRKTSILLLNMIA